MLNLFLPYAPDITDIDIYPKEMRACVLQMVCTKVFIAAKVIVAKN